MADIPPLGIVRRRNHRNARLLDIQEAMMRYLEADKPIPEEWEREKAELIAELTADIVPSTIAFLVDDALTQARLAYRHANAEASDTMRDYLQFVIEKLTEIKGKVEGKQ